MNKNKIQEKILKGVLFLMGAGEKCKNIDGIFDIIQKLNEQDCESTSYPYWIIVDPQQNMSKDIHCAASQITGVFFSRSSAEEFLEGTRYNFSKHARVYCHSGYYSWDWRVFFLKKQ